MWNEANIRVKCLHNDKVTFNEKIFRPGFISKFKVDKIYFNSSVIVATFHVLNSHMWLVVSALNGRHREENIRSRLPHVGWCGGGGHGGETGQGRSWSYSPCFHSWFLIKRKRKASSLASKGMSVLVPYSLGFFPSRHFLMPDGFLDYLWGEECYYYHLIGQ